MWMFVFFICNGTQQEYRYYAGSDRTAFTYIGGTASIDYVYDRAQLTDLIRKAYLGTTGYWQHYLLGYDTFGNMTSVRVCASSAEREGYTTPIDLATYEYEGNVYNGRLAKMAYGNGDSVSYTYDAFDRQRTAAYNDGTTYHYDYSSDNALTRQYATGSDGKITEQYSYQYDSLGRLIHSRQSTADGSLIQLTQHMYDNANRMTSQTWQFGTGLYRQQYTYTGQNSDDKVDGTISAITTTVPGKGAITSKYEYNDLRQLKSKTVKQGDTSAYTRSYTYDRIAVDSGNWMGTRLASTGYTFGSNSRSFTYTYDASGNITRIVLSGGSLTVGTKSKTYSYDALGQLVKEAPGGLARNAVNYTYDTAGNIRNITKDGTVTKSFGYTNPSWPDLLTSVTANGTTKDVLYEGQSKTSDLPTSGNPVTYYNGKDYTFTWTKGRQLASATVDGKQVSYTYDMSGVRSGKQVYTTSNQRTTTYTYTTLSGKVMRQQWETRNSDDTVYQAMQSLEFVYDDGNQPFAMIYKHGQTTELYYYVLNAQGDVIALLNADGTLVASYNYGAWGNYSVHGADGKKTTDPTFIGHINPLRYRGYYYDRETRLYYLQSRYYDFANCRFINADGLFTDGFIGANLFAYCVNNPVNMSDPSGSWPKWATKLVAAVAVVAVVAVVAAVTVATAGAGTAIAAVAVGAAKGAAIGFAVGAATGAVSGAISHRISTGSWDGAGEAALNGMASGALSGAVSGAITGGITGGLSYNSGATSAGKGFDTYRQLKNEIGSPGAGNEWHHIVEQSQISKSGFSPQMIQNTNNIMSISKTTHRAISGYYSSVQPFTNGMIVRNWLAGQSFNAQYEFGMNVIKMFM